MRTSCVSLALRRRLMLPPVLLLTLFLSSPNARPRQAVAPPQSPPAARVDADRQMRDLQALADPALEGRLTGSAGSRRAQALILERFKELGLQPIDGSFVRTFSFTEKGRGGGRAFSDATNIGAMLQGRGDPQTFVIVSAHYDHLGMPGGRTHPGADDNASGVAAMLAIARWFAAHPPRRSLLFLAFDAEEEGLEGARHFVSKPPIALDRIAAIVNMDMLGRGDANTLYVAGTHHSPSLAPIVTAAARGRKLTLKLGHDKPPAEGGGLEDWTHSSDHGPFHDAGVAFLYFGVEDHPDYHKPTDTFDKIPRAFYIEATEVVLETVRRLADGAP
jgi:hypothetical protein